MHAILTFAEQRDGKLRRPALEAVRSDSQPVSGSDTAS